MPLKQLIFLWLNLYATILQSKLYKGTLAVLNFFGVSYQLLGILFVIILFFPNAYFNISLQRS